MYEFDLHNHTSDHSDCGRMTIAELIEAAVAASLSGVCVTDHNYRWPEDAIAAALAAAGNPGIVVIPGIEVSATNAATGASAGHFLVFGRPFDLSLPITRRQLVADAHRAGCFVIAAHPFRPGAASADALGELDVDAIEVFNIQNDQSQTDRARALAASRNLPQVAGTDAHRAPDVGLCRTCFSHPIGGADELVAAIRAGEYSLRSLNPAII